MAVLPGTREEIVKPMTVDAVVQTDPTQNQSAPRAVEEKSCRVDIGMQTQPETDVHDQKPTLLYSVPCSFKSFYPQGKLLLEQASQTDFTYSAPEKAECVGSGAFQSTETTKATNTSSLVEIVQSDIEQESQTSEKVHDASPTDVIMAAETSENKSSKVSSQDSQPETQVQEAARPVSTVATNTEPQVAVAPSEKDKETCKSSPFKRTSAEVVKCVLGSRASTDIKPSVQTTTEASKSTGASTVTKFSSISRTKSAPPRSLPPFVRQPLIKSAGGIGKSQNVARAPVRTGGPPRVRPVVGKPADTKPGAMAPIVKRNILTAGIPPARQPRVSMGPGLVPSRGVGASKTVERGRGVGLPSNIHSSAPVHQQPPVPADVVTDARTKTDLCSASNSSLSSSTSSSARSWADKVKGTVMAPCVPIMDQKTVENMKLDLSTLNFTEGTDSVNVDDLDGWETVRSRSSRSKTSPSSACKSTATLGQLSQSATNLQESAEKQVTKTSNTLRQKSIKPAKVHAIHAVSMPSLSLSANNRNRAAVQKPRTMTKQLKPRQETSRTGVKSSTLPKISSKGESVTKAQQKESVKLSVESDALKGIKTENKAAGDKVMDNAKRINKEECGSQVTTNGDINDNPLKELSVICPLTEICLQQHNQANGKGDTKTNSTSELLSPCDNCTVVSHDDESVRDLEEMKQKDMALQTAFEEEKSLVKQMHETEKSEIEVDTETDTDCDTVQGTGDEDEDTEKISGTECDNLEDTYAEELEGLSWGDRVERLEHLAATKRAEWALQLHEKLSSPSRKKPRAETLRDHEEKQARARKKREEMQEDKAQRIRDLLRRIDEVRLAQEQLQEQKVVIYERKMKRAEEKRRKHIQEIVKKAHDEEEKLKEIAFINELEAQNKRHDYIALCQEQEGRLQGIQEERQRKQEEKAAKEAAVEERKRLLEAERQAKLAVLQERRRRREERIDREFQEKEKERLEMAREKARDREERLSALKAANQANAEELQKKIQQKQEETARRHEETIEQIRQKAFELSTQRVFANNDDAPRLVPYETLKLCTLCNVLIGSEVYLLSHLRGKRHQETLKKQNEDGKEVSREDSDAYSLKHITDAPADKIDPQIALDRERQKALKKRCKKLRQRMVARGEEYEKKNRRAGHVEAPSMPKLQKSVRNIQKLYNAQGRSQWSNGSITTLERGFGEINRILEKGSSADQLSFRASGGFNAVENILKMALECQSHNIGFVPDKCLTTACSTLTLACKGHSQNANYAMNTNCLSVILDLLIYRLNELIPDQGRFMSGSPVVGAGLPVDNVASSLMHLVAVILEHVADPSSARPATDNKESIESSQQLKEEHWLRVQDVVSYTVSIGVVDKVAVYFGGVREPVENEQQVVSFLLNALQLLSALSRTLIMGGDRCRGGNEPTQLVATLQVTELAGTVSMLYCLLLHQGAPVRSAATSPPICLPQAATRIAIAVLSLLIHTARLDLNMFQNVVGAEGLSLQFRHIASHLLWRCSHHTQEKQQRELLHAVITSVGYFTVKSHDNQMMVQSGHMPTVLQQLCSLPFEYFSDSNLTRILFPTLLACCHENHENRDILEQDMSFQLLDDFLRSDVGRTETIVKIIEQKTNEGDVS